MADKTTKESSQSESESSGPDQSKDNLEEEGSLTEDQVKAIPDWHKNVYENQ